MKQIQFPPGWTESPPILDLREFRDRISFLCGNGASKTTLLDLWTMRDVIEALMMLDITTDNQTIIFKDNRKETPK